MQYKNKWNEAWVKVNRNGTMMFRTFRQLKDLLKEVLGVQVLKRYRGLKKVEIVDLNLMGYTDGEGTVMRVRIIPFA